LQNEKHLQIEITNTSDLLCTRSEWTETKN